MGIKYRILFHNTSPHPHTLPGPSSIFCSVIGKKENLLLCSDMLFSTACYIVIMWKKPPAILFLFVFDQLKIYLLNNLSEDLIN